MLHVQLQHEGGGGGGGAAKWGQHLFIFDVRVSVAAALKAEAAFGTVLCAVRPASCCMCQMLELLQKASAAQYFNYLSNCHSQYGVVCTWGLSQARERELVALARSCVQGPHALDEEVDQVRHCHCRKCSAGCVAATVCPDVMSNRKPLVNLVTPLPPRAQFQYNYSAHEPPSMSNDNITINRCAQAATCDRWKPRFQGQLRPLQRTPAPCWRICLLGTRQL